MTSKILVFSGPTLSGQDSFRKKHADRFVFVSPISCGQLFEAYREGFRKFLIIDGYFDRVPAVWHKEILYVLNKGCVVYGCSSLGALRAIETEPYGMRGHGKIFDDYKSQKISDDDEVTVFHLGQEHDFCSVTDAMINIRYTLEHAIAAEAISRQHAESIAAFVKATFFKKRSLKFAAEEVLKNFPQELKKFLKFFNENGLHDQKRSDALELIEILSRENIAENADWSNPTMHEPFHHTSKLKNLQYITNINPPTLNIPALSQESRVTCLAALMIGKQRRLQSWLAIAMMLFSNSSDKSVKLADAAIPWLDENGYKQDPTIKQLLNMALHLCPEYQTPGYISNTVKLLAMEVQLPVQFINPVEAEGESDSSFNSLTLDSLPFYSRLLLLIGLFVDAIEKSDLIFFRLSPPPEVLKALIQKYRERSMDSTEFLAEFGLTDSQSAIAGLAKIQMLLNERNVLRSFDLNEEEIYWYKLSIKFCGLYNKLLTLKNKPAREKFSTSFTSALARQSKERTREYFAMTGLPDDLTNAEKVGNYIESLLG